jgi:hypothetical protein
MVIPSENIHRTHAGASDEAADIVADNIRTSNAYVFRDPQPRPEGVPASKSENRFGTQNQEIQSLTAALIDPDSLLAHALDSLGAALSQGSEEKMLTRGTAARFRPSDPPYIGGRNRAWAVAWFRTLDRLPRRCRLPAPRTCGAGVRRSVGRAAGSPRAGRHTGREAGMGRCAGPRAIAGP